MAQREQTRHVVVDGPWAFDKAISREAELTKRIGSPRWISCLHLTSHPGTFWPRTWNNWQGSRGLASWRVPACRLCCGRDPIHRWRGSPPQPSRYCCSIAGLVMPKHPGKTSLIDISTVRFRAHENRRRSLFARRCRPQDAGVQDGTRPKSAGYEFDGHCRRYAPSVMKRLENSSMLTGYGPEYRGRAGLDLCK